MKRVVVISALVLGGCLAAVFAVIRSQQATADAIPQQSSMNGPPITYNVGYTDSGRPIVEFQYDHDSVAAVQEMAASMTEQTHEAVENGGDGRRRDSLYSSNPGR